MPEGGGRGGYHQHARGKEIPNKYTVVNLVTTTTGRAESPSLDRLLDLQSATLLSCRDGDRRKLHEWWLVIWVMYKTEH